jgi:NADPH:quinone reductase-like Zn-dependent oxidoreductase
MLLVQHGGSEGLRMAEVPDPAPGPGEALVRVHATGVNHMDLLVRAGYPGIPVSLPHVLGGDVVGTVAALGEGASAVRVGERVVAAPVVSCGHCEMCAGRWPHLCSRWRYLGLHRPGGYAELIALPTRNLVPLPDSIGWSEATALPVAGLTAYHALCGLAELRAGQTLLLWGGAGSVGSMAISIARSLGVRAIVSASTAEKRALALRLGAELALDPRDPHLEERVRAAAPAGVDAVLDYVGAETFPRSFGLLKKGGQLLVCGMIGGREAPLSLHQTYLRHVTIRGLYLGTVDELRALVALAAAGRVRPFVGATLPLERAAEAQALLESRRNLGKVALAVATGS